MTRFLQSLQGHVLYHFNQFSMSCVTSPSVVSKINACHRSQSPLLCRSNLSTTKSSQILIRNVHNYKWLLNLDRKVHKHEHETMQQCTFLLIGLWISSLTKDFGMEFFVHCYLLIPFWAIPGLFLTARKTSQLKYTLHHAQMTIYAHDSDCWESAGSGHLW